MPGPPVPPRAETTVRRRKKSAAEPKGLCSAADLAFNRLGCEVDPLRNQRRVVSK